MVEIADKAYFLKEFENASKYVEDILAGKTTMTQAVQAEPQDLEEIFVRAKNALQVEDYVKAEELFVTLLILNNKDTRAAMGLGGALEGQGRYEFAMPVYFLIIATTPYDPVAPFRAGICLMNLGKKDEALKMFSLAKDCQEEIKDPAKQVYVDRASGMIQALSRA